MAIVNAGGPLIRPCTDKGGIIVSEIGFNGILENFVNQVSKKY